MKKFWVLTRLGFQSLLLRSSGGARSKRKKLRVTTALGAAALIALIGLYLSGVYSWMLLEVLAPIHMESLLFMFMGLASLVMGVMYTAFAVKNTVYGGDDNDLLLSMPVSSTTLMLSRVAAIYAESFLFSFFILVPAGVACAIVSKTGAGRTVGFWVRMLIATVTLPMLDTALSLLLGAGIAALSTRVTKKSIGQTLVMGLYLAVIFYFSFNISGMIEKLALNAMKVRTALGAARPVAWLADGILSSWGDILRFALLCVAAMAVAVLVLGALYRKAVSAFAAQSARNDYRLSGQRAAGQVKALLGKEARRFFGSAMYFWNAALGTVMLAAGSIALVVKRADVMPLLRMMEIDDMRILPLIGMGIVGFCLSTTLIAAPSVSLEGRNLWVLREAPVTTRTLLRIKTGFELMAVLPSIALTMVCVALSGLLSATECLTLAVFALVFAVGHAAFGMLMGLRFARLDAPNEAVVIKRSLLGFLAVFVPMFELVVAGVLGWLLSRAVPGWGAIEGIERGLIGFTCVFAAVSALVLIKKGEGMFNALGEQA